MTAISAIFTAVTPPQTRLAGRTVHASVGGSSNSLLARSARVAARLSNISLHLSLPNFTGQALVHPSDRVLRYLTRHAVVSGMICLEARPTVLALVILSSRGNVAGQMVARVALTRSRVGRCSFSAVGASSSLSVLVLSSSAGNANGGAGGRSYGASGAGRARSSASRSELIAADRAVGAGRLTGGRISLSRGALGAGDRPSAARVMASIAIRASSRSRTVRVRSNWTARTIVLGGRACGAKVLPLAAVCAGGGARHLVVLAGLTVCARRCCELCW